ncbi:hypothetical protein SCHPADRAFT_867387 [Schizopora paradoxa]|uniref:CHCH domain-containing protein n=1 Tax=Schizopora paradoxa TaxID=27342 RepID=A0A0H2S295_9AGAM|nr:hypothetical protein SCHPADRAFT_867387 [Schizopora paradoxa]
MSEPLPSANEGKTPLNYKEHFKGKHVVTKFIDPCEGAAKASMSCLNKHDYKKERCTEFFAAYRECKKTWMDQRKDDRRNGKDASIDVQYENNTKPRNET